MSLFRRLSTDASNACQDIYSNWVLGDDAGKSARLTLVVRPQSTRLDLGLTFLEINGRAYVKTVLEGSAAQAAGIMPQDAVQYAILFRSEWLSSSSNNSISNTEANPNMAPQPASDSLAIQYVLDLESSGMRISYDELRKLLAKGLDPTQSAFLSPTTTSTWSGPPIPSNVCVPMPVNEEEERPSSPYTTEQPRPVVFVFRRTRQRNLSYPLSFRLDDECDFATHLVQRLAPTADMQTPPPDPWDELVHDGTDWLMGRESTAATGGVDTFRPSDSDADIPLDDFEQERAQKLARLRSVMAAGQVDRSFDDVEAATIRGMIQKAVGLAFVRASKVVLGVSLHAGSGIVVARLPDGTWSAPSAIGTWGLGFGIQFGLEVAEYIFILQTEETLDHFRRGGSFTVGGNVGVAAAGLGREAYGAASVGGCGNIRQVHSDDDNYDQTAPQHLAVAPIVAYAKTNGLYVGVSLEGSRIFSRDDVNSRAYKFETGRDLTALEILSGTVPTPPEAEDLYAALHSVEFTHEMSCLPRPPEILRQDSANAWKYDRSTLGDSSDSQQPFEFLSCLTSDEWRDCEAFETQFKNFMYGGVSVQRLLPDKETRSGRTVKERRTLWLMLPEVGSLRLGFVSKLSDGEQAVSNKSSTQQARREGRLMEEIGTVGSEELTLDSALNTKDGSTIGPMRHGNVHLSDKHSVALTDVVVLSQEPIVPVRFKSEDKMEHLRVISLRDVSGTSLLFLANNFREAELLVCGLKLLLEREAARLGVRGGLPLTALGGKSLEGAMSPAAARGFRELPVAAKSASRKGRVRQSYDSEATASDVGEDSLTDAAPGAGDGSEGRRLWGRVPGRSYMRDQAHTSFEPEKTRTKVSIPHYVHGHEIVREVAKNVVLPLPLPLCRVLLLDSTSPVIKAWEKDRGDSQFEKTPWTFPGGNPREKEQHSSEHQLIASGSMRGAHRVSSFARSRYGAVVRLSETHNVEADDSRTVAFTVEERNSRRGFSICVRVVLRAQRENSCTASVFAQLRPVGKDMTNQAAIHRALMLVVDEIKTRYGAEGRGLLAGFLSVVDDMASNPSKQSSKQKASDRNLLSRPFRRTDPSSAEEEKKGGDAPIWSEPKSTPRVTKKTSGLVSFEDMLKSGRQSPETIPNGRPSTPSIQRKSAEVDTPKQFTSNVRNHPAPDRFFEEPTQIEKQEPVMIEVKPLPKIRLSLMPSPREEDEEDGSDSALPTKAARRKKSSRSRSSSSSPRKSNRSKRAIDFS